MSKHIKQKTKTTLILTIGVIVYLTIMMSIVFLERKGLYTFNGAINSVNFGVCLLLVMFDYKKGYICSLILMLFNLGMIIRSLIVLGNKTVIPGIATFIIFIISLSIIAFQFRRRENESITDFLTGLRNRRGLFKLLAKKVEEDSKFYAIYLDLGNFKFINDNFGHTYGDKAMKIIADRMGEIVGNNGVITRIGGDEFIILLNGNKDPLEVANKLISKTSEKLTVDIEDSKVDCYLNAFAGISCFPDDTMDYEALIKYADIAMYQATHDGKEKVCFFNEEMSKKLIRQMELEHLVKEGLDNGNFYLVYQPQFNISDKKLRGFETLLRLRTSDGINISPAEFIPVAENSDLILRVDEMVIKMALDEFKDVVEGTETIVSINVSAKNIASPDFPDRIRKALDEAVFPSRNLEIEITEYCLVQSVDTTIANIKKLRDMGVQIALDDFGTGYTSLTYLAKMPINLLKIDKTLIDNIASSEKARDFVKAVIDMGHLMGCEVISEGVEEHEQLLLLGEQGCDFVQGFIWGRPVEHDSAAGLTKG